MFRAKANDGCLMLLHFQREKSHDHIKTQGVALGC